MSFFFSPPSSASSSPAPPSSSSSPFSLPSSSASSPRSLSSPTPSAEAFVASCLASPAVSSSPPLYLSGNGGSGQGEEVDCGHGFAATAAAAAAEMAAKLAREEQLFGFGDVESMDRQQAVLPLTTPLAQCAGGSADSAFTAPSPIAPRGSLQHGRLAASKSTMATTPANTSFWPHDISAPTDMSPFSTLPVVHSTVEATGELDLLADDDFVFSQALSACDSSVASSEDYETDDTTCGSPHSVPTVSSLKADLLFLSSKIQALENGQPTPLPRQPQLQAARPRTVASSTERAAAAAAATAPYISSLESPLSPDSTSASPANSPLAAPMVELADVNPLSMMAWETAAPAPIELQPQQHRHFYSRSGPAPQQLCPQAHLHRQAQQAAWTLPNEVYASSPTLTASPTPAATPSVLSQKRARDVEPSAASTSAAAAVAAAGSSRVRRPTKKARANASQMRTPHRFSAGAPGAKKDKKHKPKRRPRTCPGNPWGCTNLQKRDGKVCVECEHSVDKDWSKDSRLIFVTRRQYPQLVGVCRQYGVRLFQYHFPHDKTTLNIIVFRDEASLQHDECAELHRVLVASENDLPGEVTMRPSVRFHLEGGYLYPEPGHIQLDGRNGYCWRRNSPDHMRAVSGN